MKQLLPALLCMLLLSGCQPLATIGKAQLGVSVLAVNLRDAYNVPQAADGTTWPVRYTRIADQLKASGLAPDLIVLQEAPGYWECPTDNRRLPDYAGVDLLVDALRDATGAQYRVAYLISHKQAGGEGDGFMATANGVASTRFCSARGGRALLYRPDKLFSVQAETGAAFNDESRADVHLINSLPCCNPAADRTDICALIDGPPQAPTARCGQPTPSGAAWTRRQSSTELNTDAVFSRFQVIGSGGFIHVYNVHLKHTGSTTASGAIAASMSIDALVSEMEGRFAQTPSNLLYPPLLAGDFNLSSADASVAFPRFIPAFWSSEVMGAMLGNPNSFPAKQSAYINDARELPVQNCDRGDRATVWSDHCAVYFRIAPAP